MTPSSSSCSTGIKPPKGTSIQNTRTTRTRNKWWARDSIAVAQMAAAEEKEVVATEEEKVAGAWAGAMGEGVMPAAEETEVGC